MRVFTPLSEVAFPLQSGDTFVHRLLRGGEPYLLTETAASTFERRIQTGQIEGILRSVPDRPVTPEAKSILVFFVGEVGDAVCAGPTLAGDDAKHRDRIDFVTAMGDASLFPRSRGPNIFPQASRDGSNAGWMEPAVFDYPVSLRQANVYEAWVEYDTRVHPQNREMPSVFAEAIDFPEPERKSMLAPGCDAELAIALNRICPTEKASRPRVGIILKCGSHYRSWQAVHAWHTMKLLVEKGCDCYIIGSASKRVTLKVEGKPLELWGDGIYDTSGLLTNVREYVAFLSLMDAVIAPDGGMLQLACALGKPTFGIFGPTSGKYRCAYAPTLKWFDGALDCSPCWCVGDRPPCEGKWCDAIMNIAPAEIAEQVAEAVRR